MHLDIHEIFSSLVPYTASNSVLKTSHSDYIHDALLFRAVVRIVYKALNGTPLYFLAADCPPWHYVNDQSTSRLYFGVAK